MKSTTKVAVIGASGYIGRALFRYFSGWYKTVGTCFSHSSSGLYSVDVTDANQFRNYLDTTRPDVAVFTPALTNMELCEVSSDKARALSATPLETLASWASERRARTVFLSTDGVFDGEKGKYVETDTPRPINVYGQVKWEAEQKLQGLERALIVRAAVPYDSDLNSPKFIPNAIAKLRKGEPVRGTTDLIRSPTLISDLSEAIDRLLQKSATGVYHVTGPDAITTYDIGLKIARMFGYNPALVSGMRGDEIQYNGKPSPVKRPRDCSMDCSKLAKTGMQMRSVDEGLARIKLSL